MVQKELDCHRSPPWEFHQPEEVGHPRRGVNTTPELTGHKPLHLLSVLLRAPFRLSNNDCRSPERPPLRPYQFRRYLSLNSRPSWELLIFPGDLPRIHEVSMLVTFFCFPLANVFFIPRPQARTQQVEGNGLPSPTHH